MLHIGLHHHIPRVTQRDEDGAHRDLGQSRWRYVPSQSDAELGRRNGPGRSW